MDNKNETYFFFSESLPLDSDDWLNLNILNKNFMFSIIWKKRTISIKIDRSFWMKWNFYYRLSEICCEICQYCTQPFIQIVFAFWFTFYMRISFLVFKMAKAFALFIHHCHRYSVKATLHIAKNKNRKFNLPIVIRHVRLLIAFQWFGCDED
jgi:hypothetical protein